jgi:hypothetical protein
VERDQWCGATLAARDVQVADDAVPGVCVVERQRALVVE